MADRWRVGLAASLVGALSCGGGGTTPSEGRAPARLADTRAAPSAEGVIRLAADAPLVAGEAGRLRATWREPRPLAEPFTWWSSDTSVVDVDGFGRLFPRRAGTAELVVRAEGERQAVTVDVAPAPADAFRVRFSFATPPLAGERIAYERAAARLQRVVQRAEPASLLFAGPTGQFCGGLPTDQPVQGVLVRVARWVSAAPGVVGEGMPCVMDARGRALGGVVRIRDGWRDSTLAHGSAFDTLLVEAVALHEMGHVLGLAGVPGWTSDRGAPPYARWLLPATRDEPWRWTGPAALAVAGGAAAIPLAGDPSHWATGPLALDDLMRPMLDPLAGLSAISVGVLRDRGYDVDPARAERRLDIRLPGVAPALIDVHGRPAAVSAR
ncbi:MAG: hypothetical protein NW201_14005 [Gemmatimonadales bacterium]|nr:hypothetical protein [Gemmatimonadales bacterium]